ncbi:SIR2 family protein, partial [Janthinobacterium sp.]|uniref:SIR2 family protein n=1 Tax=Janthinobacterium sp. TaxID=1871054 RepID=UPI00260414BC
MLKFFDQDDLLDRLQFAQREANKNVLFIVGSPLTAPFADTPGVSDVEQIVSMIRAEFANDKNGIAKLDNILASAEQHAYQSAFEFLIARRGQGQANNLIRRAVLNASSELCIKGKNLDDDTHLVKLENEINQWHLSPGVKALGKICCGNNDVFGQVVLTTNFDPLIEISVKSAGGTAYSSMTHSDGNIHQTTGSGVHVVHLHGYWRGSDTLHTPVQLTRERGQLKNSLASLMKNSLVVVLAYSGWDDVITEAISSAVGDDSSYPEVLWTFYSNSSQDIEARNSSVIERLRPGINRGRATLYKGINCHEFLPLLDEALSNVCCDSEQESDSEEQAALSLAEDQEALAAMADNRPPMLIDAFPKNDAWFGREQEVYALDSSTASIISISGMGGQGKSALASTFMLGAKKSDNPFMTDWRDCREQASTIQLAVAGAAARIGIGQAEVLARLEFADLANAFADRLAKVRALVVFDNIDQYVDLENGRPLDQLKVLIDSVLSVSTGSKLILTSRPRIGVEHASFQELPLSGLSRSATAELFEKKSAAAISSDELDELVDLTQGHPLWISFIASQCNMTGKAPTALLAEIRAGKGDLPENTMRATWRALSTKGQQLLRNLAELERPEVLESLDGLAGIRWNQLKKGFTNLDKMSLIVHKQQEDGSELIDLHPLVRSFVRREFPKKDRRSFIDDAIVFLQTRLDRFSKLTGINLPFEVVDTWIHKIELQINQQDFQSAIESMQCVHQSLQSHGLHEDQLRLGKRVMQEIEWSYAAATYPQFDFFVSKTLHVMVGLDGLEATNIWISKYEASVSGKGIHYVNLCEIKAYVNWFTGNFEDA